MSMPVEELRVELIRQLAEKDSSHKIYEAHLPPANVPHPFYYLEELRMPDDRTAKREIMQTVSTTVSVWHDDPYDKATVLKMLGYIGEVFQDIENNGTPSYTWHISESAMRLTDDRISSAKTVYVHGIYEITIKQIGSL